MFIDWADSERFAEYWYVKERAIRFFVIKTIIKSTILMIKAAMS